MVKFVCAFLVGCSIREKVLLRMLHTEVHGVLLLVIGDVRFDQSVLSLCSTVSVFILANNKRSLSIYF